MIDNAMYDKKITNKFMGNPGFSTEISKEVRKWLLDTFADEESTEVKLSVFDIIGSLIIREKAAAEDADLDRS